MVIQPIKTRILMPPQDDLLAAIREAIPKVEERSVLAITSKVVSIWQGRCVPKGAVPNKDTLVIQEADKYLPRECVLGNWLMHTIKHNLFIPTAGIDESNAAEHYILWPKNPRGVAIELWRWVRTTYGVRDVGVVITDSHIIPFRRGVVGVALGHYGFVPIRDYRGTRDLFGRIFEITSANLIDGLAAAGVMVMGEGTECTPLALITDLPCVEFLGHGRDSEDPDPAFQIAEEEDFYYPLLSRAPWQTGGGGRE